MGADDDADCVEHVWGLEELHFSERGTEWVSTCSRCGAVSYQPPASEEAGRPKL